jgi:hypothetical protein
MSPLLVDAVPAVVAQIAVPVQDPAPPPGKGDEFGKASPIALVVILMLALATILLIRGMSKRIRRLPASFEPAEEDQKGDKEKAGGEPANGSTA